MGIMFSNLQQNSSIFLLLTTKMISSKRRGTVLRRFVAFQPVNLFKLFIHMTFVNVMWKSELTKLFRIPYSLWRSTTFFNSLRDISLTIRRCYNDASVRSVFPRASWLWNFFACRIIFFDLRSK